MPAFAGGRRRGADPVELLGEAVSAASWPTLADAGDAAVVAPPRPASDSPWPAPPAGGPWPWVATALGEQPPDRWPALPDDRSLWSPPVTAFTAARVRRLDDEQRGA